MGQILSKKSYTIRYVRYEYRTRQGRHVGRYISYAQSDEQAQADCYKDIIPSKLDTFRIVGIVKKHY